MNASTPTSEPLTPTARKPRQASVRFRDIEARVRDWITALGRDPDAEARAMDERRARLLEELNRAVAEAPDDMPIRDVIAQLNRHSDD